MIIDFQSLPFVQASIASAQLNVTVLTDRINEQVGLGTPMRKATVFERRRLVAIIRELKLLENSLKFTEKGSIVLTTITPTIGRRHLKRNGDVTGIIVSSEGVCVCPERYPYMEEGNVDPVACWAVDGQWDDRGSAWDDDIVGVVVEDPNPTRILFPL